MQLHAKAFLGIVAAVSRSSQPSPSSLISSLAQVVSVSSEVFTVGHEGNY